MTTTQNEIQREKIIFLKKRVSLSSGTTSRGLKNMLPGQERVDRRQEEANTLEEIMAEMFPNSAKIKNPQVQDSSEHQDEEA
jgi:hypothetical protein